MMPPERLRSGGLRRLDVCQSESNSWPSLRPNDGTAAYCLGSRSDSKLEAATPRLIGETGELEGLLGPSIPTAIHPRSFKGIVAASIVIVLTTPP